MSGAANSEASLRSWVTRSDGGGVCSAPNNESADLPMPGSNGCKAAITYKRKREISLSSSSSESHATLLSGRAWIHSLTRVDFPKPAGADIIVKGRRVASSRSAISLALLTCRGLGGGTRVFVLSSAAFSVIDHIEGPPLIYFHLDPSTAAHTLPSRLWSYPKLG